MKEGSLVLTVYDFTEERLTWGLDYPHKNDILTISHMEPSPKFEDIILLWFSELDLPVGLCDKNASDGTPNFIEVQSPEKGEEVLKNATKKETIFYEVEGMSCCAISEECLFPNKQK